MRMGTFVLLAGTVICPVIALLGVAGGMIAHVVTLTVGGR